MADLHLDFIDYKKLFKDREKRLQIINKLSFIPTKPYLKMIYWLKTGKRLNLKNPKTFSEKINWLKVNDIHPEYSKYVDKYEFKKIMIDKFGSEHVIELLGVWNHFNEIDFDKLPNQFVLKCTHDSGSIKIVKDKTQINKQELECFFENRLKVNQYNLSREYPYKSIKPRIIAEKYYETKQGKIINDYRIFCFNGEPKIGYKFSGRYGEELQNWFDMDFDELDIIDPTATTKNETLMKPICFDEMKNAARELSKGIKLVRVDFYEDEGQYFFGEMTFFPYGGFVILQPDGLDETLGNFLHL